MYEVSLDCQRIGVGCGGFMSPMRRVVEAARRTPEAHYTNNGDAPRESQEMTDARQVDGEGDSPLRQLSPIERNIPTTNEQWEDNREPEIIREQIPLLNGVLPTSRGELERTSETIGVTTMTPITTTRTIPMVSVSISSTPQVSSTGIEEGISTIGPICLPEEDPQIPCLVCGVDCMIHNPRYRYCMNCGQRLLGPHTCLNELENLEPHVKQHLTPQVVTGPIEQEQRQTYVPEGSHILLPKDTDAESFGDIEISNTQMRHIDSATRPVPPI